MNNKIYTLGNRSFEIPIIQGGMGIGISLGNLAGHVAACGAIGVISSANCGFKEEDFYTNSKEANLRALRNQIRTAKEISKGRGLVGVNIMHAAAHYGETVRCAAEAGADLIISGAGLPMNMPEYVTGTDALIAPIVSSGRAAKLLLRSFDKKYGRKPDLFIIEGHEAGGHLGFTQEELTEHSAKENEDILKEVLEICGDIPVYVAGGVYTGSDMAHFMKLGASGVQIGTRFIATDECDAAPGFKQVILNASENDIRIIKSPVGMPARAINTSLLKRLDRGETFGPKHCTGCLSACPKNESIPYCISRALIEAAKGNINDGLFFTGANAGRIECIVPTADLIDEIMKEYEVARS